MSLSFGTVPDTIGSEAWALATGWLGEWWWIPAIIAGGSIAFFFLGKLMGLFR